MCDMNCLKCVYEDCINDNPATENERKFSNSFDKNLVMVVCSDMTPYIHNRIDKEEYVICRNRGYDKKRDREKRRQQKRAYYLKHREERLEYQNQYQEEHAEEHRARERARYEAHKDEINAKRRERYRLRKEQEALAV